MKKPGNRLDDMALGGADAFKVVCHLLSLIRTTVCVFLGNGESERDGIWERDDVIYLFLLSILNLKVP